MELIRLLLTKTESGTDPKELTAYSMDEKIYNLQLMDDFGLVVAHFIRDINGKACQASIERLTWDGHDFLDATRDSKIWAKAKEYIIKPGVSWTFETLLEFLKREIEQRFLGGPAE